MLAHEIGDAGVGADRGIREPGLQIAVARQALVQLGLETFVEHPGYCMDNAPECQMLPALLKRDLH